MRIWRNGRRAGFRFQSERVQVQLLLSAPANLVCITLQLRLDKSVCIAPDNIASQTLFKKYGFTKHGKRKCWDVYLCDKDFYPDELKQLKMVEIEKHHKSFNRKNFR